VANCQVGGSVHAVTDPASCPLDGRLFLPESWATDTERRRKAQVPDRERHRPTWRLALELLDELAGWGLGPPVLLAEAASGEVGEVRLGLEQRELASVVQVPGTISADPAQVAPETAPSPGRGRRPGPATGNAARRCGSWSWPPLRRRPARSPGATAPTGSNWGRGWWRWGCARPGSGCAAPAGAASCRCAGWWPSGPGRAEPVTSWLASCPPTPRCRAGGLAKLRWRVEHDDRELKDALGLDHFEGRSWPGWHHHLTLVSVAHGFVTLERLDPTAAASA
jgi:SRSO17 transposase